VWRLINRRRLLHKSNVFVVLAAAAAAATDDDDDDDDDAVGSPLHLCARTQTCINLISSSSRHQRNADEMEKLTMSIATASECSSCIEEDEKVYLFTLSAM